MQTQEPKQIEVLERKLNRLIQELGSYRGDSSIPWKRQQIIREEINTIKRRLHQLGAHNGR